MEYSGKIAIGLVKSKIENQSNIRLLRIFWARSFPIEILIIKHQISVSLSPRLGIYEAERNWYKNQIFVFYINLLNYRNSGFADYANFVLVSGLIRTYRESFGLFRYPLENSGIIGSIGEYFQEIEEAAWYNFK